MTHEGQPTPSSCEPLLQLTSQHWRGAASAQGAHSRLAHGACAPGMHSGHKFRAHARGTHSERAFGRPTRGTHSGHARRRRKSPSRIECRRKGMQPWFLGAEKLAGGILAGSRQHVPFSCTAQVQGSLCRLLTASCVASKCVRMHDHPTCLILSVCVPEQHRRSECADRVSARLLCLKAHACSECLAGV